MNQLTIHDKVWVPTEAKQRLTQIRKIDYDSVPAAYAKSVKISVMDNTSESSNLSYSFYATLDSDAVFTAARIIDHVVISPGGGTAWLNLNRKIWHGGTVDENIGGPITIWGECSDSVDSATYTMTAFCVRAEFVDA